MSRRNENSNSVFVWGDESAPHKNRPFFGWAFRVSRQLQRSLLLALVLLLSACSGGREAVEPTAVPTPATLQKPTYTVERGTVTRVLQLQGRVSPVQQQELFFRTDGFVRVVNVSRGGLVKAGEVLAELELGDLNIQLAQTQLALQQSEARLAQAQQDNVVARIEAEAALERANQQAMQAGALGISPSIADAEAAVRRAEQVLQVAEMEYERARRNADLNNRQKEEYRQKVQAAEAALAVAKQRLESAQEYTGFEETLTQVQETLQEKLQAYRQALTDPETTAEQRAAAGQELEEAKTAFVEAWGQYAEIVAGPGYLSPNARSLVKEVALARLRLEEVKLGVDSLIFLEVEQRRLDLETIQNKIDQARLIAPFDGQILSMSLTPGSQVTAFRPVLNLANPDVLEITVRPTPEDLSVLSVGQAVTVQFLGRGTERYPGTIRLLPLSSADADDADQVAYITLDDPNIPLTLGEAATVVVEVERRDNVLWISPAALRSFQGRDFVFIIDNGVQRRVDIQLGLRSDERVEIVEGLVEGQTVVGP